MSEAAPAPPGSRPGGGEPVAISMPTSLPVPVSAGRRRAQTATSASATIYNRVFWLAYAANLALVTANALTFRFAEFVRYLGGTEEFTGTVISAGLFGALAARLFLGQAIDRYGTRTVWLLSAVVFTSGCVMFPLCTTLSPLIHTARIAFAVGLAGMFSCSIVHIQNQVPPHRRPEAIGNLGTSGFIGMIAGTQLGDALFHLVPPGRLRYVVMFVAAAMLGVAYAAIVVMLTRGDRPGRPQPTPPLHRLIVRYWPGPVVLVAVMMGVSFTVTTVFLTRYSTYLGLRGIGTFFTVYAVSAFVFRVGARHWSRTIGRHRMILLGLGGHALAQLLLPLVRQEWHYIGPALAGGFGHALLFPAVVSLGADAFPSRFRGTGTTVVLGFTELGQIVSAPLLGRIIDSAGFTWMFLTAAGSAVAIGIYYAATAARTRDVLVESQRLPESAESTPTGDRFDAEPPPGEAPLPIPFPHIGRNA